MTPHSILVTGATGFVGRHLVPALQAAFPEAALHTDYFDVTLPDACATAVRAARPDACIHLAGIAAIPAARRDPDTAWRINLHGTIALARVIQDTTPDCVFLHVSTADAYGLSFRAGTPLDETAPLAPANTYAATKAAADLAIGAMAADGLRAIRARPFNHTGPGQSDEFVVAAFAAQIARIVAGRQPPTLRVGRLDPERDFLDVRDVCAAYIACLTRADHIAPGTILNIASGQRRQIGSILTTLLTLANTTATIESEPSRLRPNDIPTACGNPAAATATLHWQPSIPWDQTLRDVLAWWRGR